MPAEELLKYLDHPEQLNQDSLAAIEQWVEQYPFFQTAHLLHIKNIQNLEGNVEKPVLNHTAAYVSDRKVLYYLLHSLPSTAAETEPVSEAETEPESEQQPFEELQPPEKEIKDTLEENIHDTIHKQRDLYDLQPETQIELIPGLAIDIKKAYGEDDIEFEEHNFSLQPENREELFELIDEDGAVFTEKEATLDSSHSNSEEQILEIDYTDTPGTTDTEITSTEPDTTTPDQVKSVEKSENEITTPAEDIQESTYSNEKELHDDRNRSFTDWLDSLNQENFTPPDAELIPESIDQADDFEEQSTEKINDGIKFEIPYDLNKLSQQDDPITGDLKERDSLKKTEHSSLIDQFIQSNPKIIPKKEKGAAKDISEDSVKEHESFFTDTLAQIYIKQGNYAKAILAYEKLSLKYPEKSAYFAGQISEIKKLISKS